MIYCKLKNKDTNSASYYAGTTVNDMTGEVVFFKGEREPEIIKQSDKYPITLRSLANIYRKHISEFSDGKFPEKMAYEI